MQSTNTSNPAAACAGFNPKSGIEAVRRPARRAEEVNWRVDGFVIPLPGTWHVRVDILISDFELVELEGKVEIRR